MRWMMTLVLVMSLSSTICPAGDTVAKSWIGKSRSQVVEKWGEPTSVKPARKGGEVLIYELQVPAGEFQYAPEASATYTTSGLAGWTSTFPI